MTAREKVKQYIPMVKFIAAICGPRYEVVLHCLDDLDHSIVAIENGHITGRSVGDGLRDYALDSIFNKKYTQDDFIANFSGRSECGKLMRYSSYYIKDEKGSVIGFIGVNADITPMEKIREIIDSELFFGNDKMTLSASPVVLSASETVNAAIDETLKMLGYDMPSKMRKKEKVHVISVLDKRNMFSLKGSISIIAKRLGISEPTVYRYIHESKSKE